MKLLVMSDSHAALRLMRCCVDVLKPDRMIHLGDYFDDGVAIAEEYPQIPMLQVPGNCDRYRCPPGNPEIRSERIGGAEVYMTHGHRHNVKLDTTRLLADARACHADIVLYGHTHEAVCFREPDGLWVLNPGSCGYGGGSVGLVEIQDGKIISCRILRQSDLEEMI